MTHTDATQARGGTPVDAAERERPARWISWSAWAGIVGPLLFTATFLAQEAFRRDEYHPLAEPVSALEAGPNGWIQQLNFVVFGVLTIAFAIGLHRGIRPTRSGIVGPALLLVAIGGTLVVPDATPLHDWLGLYQRLVVLAVIFPCRVVLSLRLLQIASGRR